MASRSIPCESQAARIVRMRVGMGTFVCIEAEACDMTCASTAVEAAYAIVHRLEGLLHPTRPGSDLRRINEGPTGVDLPLEEPTYVLLHLCRQLHLASQGLFDPCMPDAPGRMVDVALSTTGERPAVLLAKPVQLDLGGVAKGFAVDWALAALRGAGCTSALVNAGGDLATFGLPREIILRNSWGTVGSTTVRNAALASSDAAPIAAPHEHRGYYHGATRVALHGRSASVRAPTAAVADALTKCVIADAEERITPALLAQFEAHRVC